MTYGELLASLARITNRTDLAPDMPEFVRRAHDLIVDRITLHVALPLSNGGAALPVDLSEVVSVWVRGQPARFTVDGSNISVAVSAGTDWTADIVYRPAKAFFADEAATNTVLTDYPWVYRYGSLAEAWRFLLFDGMALNNETAFMQEISAINRASVTKAAGQITPKASSCV